MSSHGFIAFSKKMKPCVYAEMKQLHSILKVASDTKAMLKQRINDSTSNALMDMWDELSSKERNMYEQKNK